MYVGKVIEDIIRPKTGNTSYTVDSTTGETTEGISQTLIIEFINNALTWLQSRIIANYPDEFVIQNVQNTVRDQEAYTITDNIFLNNKFIAVWYSDNGQLDSYNLLSPARIHERDTRSGKPYKYIRQNGQILLNCIPDSSQGKLRVAYYRALNALGLRTGIVEEVNAGNLKLTSEDVYLNSFALEDAQYICTADSFGNVSSYNLKVESYDRTNLIIYIDSATTPTTDVAVGDYVVIGRYTSTHIVMDNPHLPNRMMDFCKVFAQARILNTDSSTDEITERTEVTTILTDIIDQFAEMTEDVQDVPITDELLRS